MWPCEHHHSTEKARHRYRRHASKRTGRHAYGNWNTFLMLHLSRSLNKKNPNAFRNNQAIGDINHFDSFPTCTWIPGSSIGLSWLLQFIPCGNPLNALWPIKPTALPVQNTSKKSQNRMARTKRVSRWIAQQLVNTARQNVIRRIDAQNGHRCCGAASSELGWIEPATHGTIHVAISMDACTIRCYGRCGDQRGRQTNCHWRRRGV